MRLLFWLLPLAGLIALLMLERLGFPPQSGGNLPAAGSGLLITFSSEINGYLTPCGCSKPMVGGIPRRASLLKQLAKTHTLVTSKMAT
jgi:hypothetical protein